MNLIFNEYLTFLKEKNPEIEKFNLTEGYFWLDNSIIKAYDDKGELHKIVRVCIDDNLEITYKNYKENKKDKEWIIESWQDTIYRNIEKLNGLEYHALILIDKYIEKYRDYKLAIPSSGGKDSSVTTHLVRKFHPETEIIFGNTSLDCAETYLNIKSLDNVKIINPKEGFYQWQKRNNYIPTRFARACCSIFKEGEMVEQLDANDKYLFFMGMRNDESNTRSEYVDEWKNDKWGNREWNSILPIRKWKEEDIWLYIIWRQIPINKKYKYGYARVGCSVCCPYYTKSTWVLDKYWYPKGYNRWHKILDDDFIDNSKALIMNCTKKEYHLKWNGGVVRDEPTEEVIKEFAEQSGINIEVAKNYFNHTCEECGKRIKSKEVIGMNLKLSGRNTMKFYCKKHLIKSVNIDKVKWDEYVQDFKNQGCSLF